MISTACAAAIAHGNHFFCLYLQSKSENIIKLKNVHRNSILDDSSISLPVFPFKNSLKLQNISVTPKLVKKVIIILDLSFLIVFCLVLIVFQCWF